MNDRISLSYFYGKESEQFSFYKIPKLLFTDEYYKEISVEAKVLYGLMLDRMSLSMKNQWLDEEGRAYIYFSLEDIMESLGCSNKKAITMEMITREQMLMDGKVTQENYVELTAASAIPNKEIKSPQILRY